MKITNINQILPKNPVKNNNNITVPTPPKKDPTLLKPPVAYTPSKDYEGIVTKMKLDSQAQMKNLRNLVKETMLKQGVTIGNADDVWKFLAKGDFTVTEEEKAAAQEAISEDGYWGVKKTSDRIVDFAIAISGNDKSKSEELLNAIEKGFKAATKTWGKELPEISKKTYEAVLEKMEAWSSKA